jgi:hypothetical protein
MLAASESAAPRVRQIRTVVTLLLAAATSALLLAVAFASPAYARDTEWDMLRISAGDGSNFGVCLSGNHVIYVHGSVEEGYVVDSLRLYDIATGATEQLTNAAMESVEGASISGTRVVWGSRAPLDAHRRDIVVRDIGAESQYLLTESAPYGSWNPSISGDLVAYVAWDLSGTGEDVFAQDLASGEVRNLTNSGFSMQDIWDVYTDGRWIVIDQPATGSSPGQVLLFDWEAPAGTPPRLLDQVDPSRTMALGDGLLAWASAIGVHTLDLATMTERIVGSDDCWRVATDGHMLAWEAYDSVTGSTLIRVTDTAGTVHDDIPAQMPYIDTLAVESNRVVWSAAADFSWLTDAEVYLALSVAHFVDVPDINPYAEAINDLYNAGIITGYSTPSGTEFRPDNNVWRAQFAKMVDITLGVPVSEGFRSPFTDLGPNDPTSLYPHEFVAQAYAYGITQGLTPTTFGPFEDISRAQVVTMLVRALQNLRPGRLVTPPAGYDALVPSFSDIHDGNMAIAQYNGLLKELQGYGESWDPWQKASRAEVAQMLHNVRWLLGLLT